MSLIHLQPSSYRRMPWKNGLGVTTELARSPQDGDFDWRVSIAQVLTDGPFSTFPGCDRVILALEGAGMVLTHHDTGTEAALGTLEPWAFSGEWDTSCVLRDGVVRDFNVITRRAAFTTAVSVLRVVEVRTVELVADTTLLYCASGELLVDATQTVALAPDHTLILVPNGGKEFISLQPSTSRSTVIQVELFAATAS